MHAKTKKNVLLFPNGQKECTPLSKWDMFSKLAALSSELASSTLVDYCLCEVVTGSYMAHLVY